MQKYKLFWFLMLLGVLLVAQPLWINAEPINAVEAEATQAMQQWINELTSALQDLPEKVPANVSQVIETRVFPRTNFDHLGRNIFGKPWDQVVAEKKDGKAIDAIKKSLIRTYTVALTAYDGQSIQVERSRQKKDFAISTVQIATKDKPIRVDYALEKINGEWKLFDLSIDGIALGKTLRGSIKNILATEGIDPAIAAIAAEK